MEKWKDIVGYKGIYQISNKGRVKTLLSPIKLRHKNNILSTNMQCSIRNGKGYKCVFLYKHGKPKQFMVHRLVAIAFIPNPKNKSQVNHIDGDKHNNIVHNLEWVTNSENIEHAVKLGLSGKGEKNSMSKLTRNDVLMIRRQYKEGSKVSYISDQFKICKQQVYSIINKTSWSHI